MRFRKVYLEISNICNLICRFCPGTKRPKKALTEEEITLLLPKIRPYTDYLYFHLMGEPLLHKHLARFLELAGEHGFKGMKRNIDFVQSGGCQQHLLLLFQ